jgi:monoamine oxidase
MEEYLLGEGVPVSKLGARAVICGAGMGGLLAARVLADFYETVMVVHGIS